MRRVLSAAIVAISVSMAAPPLLAADPPKAAAAQTAPAQTAPATVAPFDGPWVGRSGPASDRDRLGTVLIERFSDESFRITWTNFEADADASEGVARRDRSLVFRPSAAPGIWVADKAGDPFEQMGAWARVRGSTLEIDIVALRADGRLERQSYERTLTPDGLLMLSYRRWLDQTSDRHIEAKFIRL